MIDQFIPLRDAEVKIPPVNALRGFLTQIQKPASKYSEAAMATTEGKEAFEEILQHYNAIAQWLGFPPLSKKS